MKTKKHSNDPFSKQMESVWHCIRRHTGQTWPFTITDKDSINQRSSPEAPGDSGGAAETKRTTINHVPHETDFLWKSGKRKSTNPGGGHGKHEEEGALIDSELFGLRAKCYVYLDPRCQGKHATPTVEDGGGSTSRDRKLASVGGKTDGAKFRAVLQT